MYEASSGQHIADDVRVATMLKYAPAPVKMFLKLTPLDTLENYGKIRDGMLTYLSRTRYFYQEGMAMDTPVPMDVSALQDPARQSRCPGRARPKARARATVKDKERAKARVSSSRGNHREDVIGVAEGILMRSAEREADGAVQAAEAAKAKGNQADLGDPRAEARARHGQADLAEGRCSPEAVHGVDRGRSRPAEHFRDGAGGVAGKDTEWRPAESCWR